MAVKKLVFVGVIVSPVSLCELSIQPGYLKVEDGKITGKGTEEEYKSLKSSGALSGFEEVILGESQFLMPGLVDCHIHAPQFPNIGLGLDRPLLEWLDKYTFPLECQYGNVEFARDVYNQVVQRLLKNGTTTACYFGSIHLEGTLELVKSVVKYRQRALVGKVSMNIENDAGYYNETGKELRDVESFVQKVLAYRNDLVQPVITPRFAVSCDTELMNGLSKIAEKYDCRIQSHISENIKEIEHVLNTNQNCKSYAEVYDRSKLLNDKCIMAHAVHLTDTEITLMASKGVAVAHCPSSNTRLKSGLCPVKKLLDNNIKVGLGTDVSGGDSSSILDVIRRTMDVSTHLELQGSPGAQVNWREALCLATLGGARALNLEDRIGSLDVGKELDALLVDVYTADGPVDQYGYAVDASRDHHAVSLIERFVHLGDDRNIRQVYVKGDRVKNLS
ncbi:amidohydrolase family domain-containing protein [Phthorimaea operculella]|nr:amidohydrolase family domain-containing protein [Phthorimaea operculella]